MQQEHATRLLQGAEKLKLLVRGWARGFVKLQTNSNYMVASSWCLNVSSHAKDSSLDRETVAQTTVGQK